MKRKTTAQPGRRPFHIAPEKIVSMVESLQRDEKDAFDEIYRVFNKKVYGQIFKKTHNYELTQTLTDDVFLIIKEKIGTLKNPKAFVSWCNRIVVAVYNDHYREQYREERREQKAIQQFYKRKPKKRKWNEKQIEILGKKLEYIPPKQAIIMQMHYIDRYSVEEIARSLGLPAGTVKSRLHYGRAAFDKLLTEKDVFEIKNK